MTFTDALRSAFLALRINAMRSSLTAIGIIIGVAAVIVMISIGAGAEARVNELIRSLGANVIIIQNGQTSASGVRIKRGVRNSITRADAHAIEREISGVSAAAPLVQRTAHLVQGNRNWAAKVLGVSVNHQSVREWGLRDGHWISQNEVNAASKVALIGRTASNNLFAEGEDPLGQVMRINKIPFTIIGTLHPKGETPGGGDQDDVVMIPVSTAKKRLVKGRRFKGDLVNKVYVKVHSAELIDQSVHSIRELLRSRHRLQAGQLDDFYIHNQTEVMEARSDSSRIMTMLLASVASISLLVGGIGVMNIMLVSVTERTREIGLRMAVGARAGDVLTQFMIEAVSLSVLGGIVGIFLGVGGSIALAVLSALPIVILPLSIVVASVFSAAVGIFFGYYPALKASRLKPIEALRFE